MNRKEYNILDSKVKKFVKESKTQYIKMVNEITDKILEPYNLSHRTVFINGENTYKVNKAYISSDDKIIVNLDKKLYDLITDDRIDIPLFVLLSKNSNYKIKYSGYNEDDNT